MCILLLVWVTERAISSVRDINGELGGSCGKSLMIYKDPRVTSWANEEYLVTAADWLRVTMDTLTARRTGTRLGQHAGQIQRLDYGYADTLGCAVIGSEGKRKTGPA